MSLALKLVLSPLLVAQAVLTRARLPRLPEAGGERAGVAGAELPGPALRLLLAGDSSAAGVGVVDQRDALAGQLVQRLVTLCGRPVPWHLSARSGLTTAQTLALLQAHGPAAPLGPLPPADVAVVVTGVNDVVGQVPLRHAVAARHALADWLRGVLGVQHVVFAPLPPLHQFPGLPQPLRWVAGADARRHNAALCAWAAARQAGSGDVSCVAMDVPLHRAVMASDGFHPGAAVYRRCADAIAGHVARHVLPRLHHH